jgi:hypothetical protein
LDTACRKFATPSLQGERTAPGRSCKLQCAGSPEQAEAPVYTGLRPGTVDAQGTGMVDLLLVLATAAFFALSWGYARICEKL